MPELTALALILTGNPAATGITPADAAADSVLAYWLSFGAVAVIGFALFWLYVWPGRLTKQARTEARADLLEENQRLRDRADRAEEQRDQALRVASEKIVPLLAAFTTATDALLPLLQWQVRDREEHALEQRRQREERRGRPPR